MDYRNEDRHLHSLFQDLRRNQSAHTPSFDRICQSANPQRARLAHGARFSLAAVLGVLLVLAAVCFHYAPARQPPPDLAAIVASALRSLAQKPAPATSLDNWESPTAFLLSPLTASTATGNSNPN